MMSLVLLGIVMWSGCATEDGVPADEVQAAAAQAVPGPMSARNRFAAAVVDRFGMDGTACYQRGARTYCLSPSRTRPRALRRGELAAVSSMYLCARVRGRLQDCRPASAALGDWGCDDDQCWCDGLESCEILASSTCTGGSCGDCGDHECCCTPP
jgi:hypothetical protein